MFLNCTEFFWKFFVLLFFFFFFFLSEFSVQLLKMFGLFKAIISDIITKPSINVYLGLNHRYAWEIPDLVYHPAQWRRQPWGSNWGIQVFTDHIRKYKHKTNASTFFVCRVVFFAFFSSRSDHSQTQMAYTHENYSYFDYFDPQFEPIWAYPMIHLVVNMQDLRFGCVVFFFITEPKVGDTDCQSKWNKNTKGVLRGHCTPNQKLACFVLYLTIINTFFE